MYNGFFTDPGLNAIGYVHDDGGIGEYPLPHPSSGPSDITEAGISTAIFWFSEANAARIGSIDPNSGHIREHVTYAPLLNVASGPDFWTYATDVNGDVEMIDPLGHVTRLAAPLKGARLAAIATGADDDMWVLASTATSTKLVEILY
jgi:streptogramin lyase